MILLRVINFPYTNFTFKGVLSNKSSLILYLIFHFIAERLAKLIAFGKNAPLKGFFIALSEKLDVVVKTKWKRWHVNRKFNVVSRDSVRRDQWRWCNLWTKYCLFLCLHIYYMRMYILCILKKILGVYENTGPQGQLRYQPKMV